MALDKIRVIKRNGTLTQEDYNFMAIGKSLFKLTFQI